MPDGPRYDDDFYAWTQYQAEVLRTMGVTDSGLDIENLAEEIESAGRRERDEIRDEMRRVLRNFLKLEYSSPGRERYGWMGAIVESRFEMRNRISPSLSRDAELMLPELYSDAFSLAVLDLKERRELQAAARLPNECPYTLTQICADEWYPQPAEP